MTLAERLRQALAWVDYFASRPDTRCRHVEADGSLGPCVTVLHLRDRLRPLLAELVAPEAPALDGPPDAGAVRDLDTWWWTAPDSLPVSVVLGFSEDGVMQMHYPGAQGPQRMPTVGAWAPNPPPHKGE